MNDVFTPDAFKVLELTESINLMPYVPGAIQAMNLFQTRSVFNTMVAIEYKGGKLSLIQTQERGLTNGARITLPKGKVIPFKIPHIPQMGTVTPDDLPDMRAFGTKEGKVAFSTVVADILEDMRQNLETTIEYHMSGALKGIIKDADGTEIFDLFDIFGITEEEVDINMGSDDLRAKCALITRTVQDFLGADSYREIRVLCGDTLYDHLISSQEVKDSPVYKTQGNGPKTSDPFVRESFYYGGITWVNYRGTVGSTSFIGLTEGRVVPMGVPKLFIRRNGPADTVDAVGRMGKPFVVTREFLPHDTGVELRAQGNPLILCTRPSVLIKINDTYEATS